jgi:PAS domain S-box-containing protein
MDKKTSSRLPLFSECTAQMADLPYHQHEHELLLNAIVDYAIYMLDLEGRVITWNPGAQRIKGYTPDEILGQSFSRFFTEDDRLAGKPQRILHSALTNGRHQDEGWRLRKDGTRFWALAVLDVVRNARGELIGLAKITRDMTEQHQMMQAISQSERNFRLLVEGVHDYAIYLLDPHGRIVSWNSGAERIKGYSAHEAIGQHYSRFFSAEEQTAGVPQQALQHALDHGRYESEGWQAHKDGRLFWANVVIAPIHGEEGQHIGFSKVTRDITERRAAQRALDTAKEQLFQSQKLQALGQFTSGVAHDFNNLLAIILGSSELLLRGASDERSSRHLNNIIQAAQRGRDTTQQLLAFARQQPLETRRVDLKQLLSDSLSLFEQSLHGHHSLRLVLPEVLSPVEIDPNQLQLALLNLIINARDASAEAGEIRLEAADVELHGEFEGLSGPFVAVSVIDSGTGIDPEILNRIFDPFFTTKGFGKGTGLGLSQVYGFAKQSGGGISVRSTLGQGCVMTLYLQVSQRAQPVERNRTLRILLVEDDLPLAEVTTSMLISMGHQVVTAETAQDALQRLNQQNESIDLLLSDVLMPGGTTGMELANRVRQRQPELPILLLTGYSSLVRQSAYPVLNKPYTYGELEQALDQLLIQPER